MTQKDNKENEIGKFPVNSASLAGLVERVSFNEKDHRANVTLVVSQGKTPAFINVLISGKERFDNFKDNYNAAITSLGKDDNDKQIKPCMFVTGQSFFSSNTPENGPTHQNFTLIAQGDMKNNNESFQLTGNSVELDSFRKEFHSGNPIINHINIRGRISNDPKQIDAQNGSFHKLSIAHNYVVNDETTKAMYANVIIPGSLADQVKASQPVKGVAILLSGKIQPISYMKGEQKVHSFNIVTTSLQRDLTNTTTVKKAAEGIDKVANVANKKDRLNEAQVQKDGLKL